MERITRFRIRILSLAFAVVAFLYGIRLYDLQVIETGGNTDNTTTFTTYTTVKAARGDILDKNGNVLVSNRASYNLVISGHHMNNGSMFGQLPLYRDKSHWESRKIVEFDTLMERKLYVIFAVFYSADYDEHEEGFRYNRDIQYRIDAEQCGGCRIESCALTFTGVCGSCQ